MSVIHPPKIRKIERFQRSRRVILTSVFLIHTGGRKYRYLGAGLLTVSPMPGGIAMALLLLKNDFFQAVGKLKACPHKTSHLKYSEALDLYKQACHSAPTIFLK